MNAYDDWWHVAHTPDGVHAHHLPPAVLVAAARRWLEKQPPRGEGEEPLTMGLATAEAAGAYAQAIRDELGFPQDWFGASGFVSMLTVKIPHDDLMALACQGCDANVHDGLPELTSWP